MLLLDVDVQLLDERVVAEGNQEGVPLNGLQNGVLLVLTEGLEVILGQVAQLDHPHTIHSRGLVLLLRHQLLLQLVVDLIQEYVRVPHRFRLGSDLYRVVLVQLLLPDLYVLE